MEEMKFGVYRNAIPQNGERVEPRLMERKRLDALHEAQAREEYKKLSTDKKVLIEHFYYASKTPEEFLKFAEKVLKEAG